MKLIGVNLASFKVILRPKQPNRAASVVLFFIIIILLFLSKSPVYVRMLSVVRLGKISVNSLDCTERDGSLKL